jgi:hypothetical protein
MAPRSQCLSFGSFLRLYASGFCCYKIGEAMFWRIVFWVAVVEVLVCLVPFELAGIIILLNVWHIGG